MAKEEQTKPKSKRKSGNIDAKSGGTSPTTKKVQAKTNTKTKAKAKTKVKAKAKAVQQKQPKSSSKNERVKSKAKKSGVRKSLASKAPHTATDSSADTDSDALVKKIWLAGLGAYGLSRDQVLRRGDAFKETGQQFFDSLVERGEEVQDDTSGALNQKIDSLEERIDNIKEQLKDGYTASPVGRKVNHLSKIVEDLQAKTKKRRK